MLPNALSPIMVNITLSPAMFILTEAGLSFLGLGVPLNIPTWGNILNVAQDILILHLRLKYDHLIKLLKIDSYF